jgi:hypothetical protein
LYLATGSYHAHAVKVPPSSRGCPISLIVDPLAIFSSTEPPYTVIANFVLVVTVPTLAIRVEVIPEVTFSNHTIIHTSSPSVEATATSQSAAV